MVITIPEKVGAFAAKLWPYHVDYPQPVNKTFFEFAQLFSAPGVEE
jgi:hypothetical protein